MLIILYFRIKYAISFSQGLLENCLSEIIVGKSCLQEVVL